MTGINSPDLRLSQDDWKKIRSVLTGQLRLADTLALLGLDRSRDFQGLNLQGTNFKGCDLTDFNLSGTNLSGADLSGANLARAILRGADLRGADLRAADLSGADLRGADLRDARGFGRTIPTDVRTDAGTRWPSPGPVSPWAHRPLSEESRDRMLKRNIAGMLRPNRDYYLWVLVNVLSMLLLCRSRQPGAFNPVVCAQNVVLEGGGALEKLCIGQDGVRLSDDGIAVDANGLKYKTSWAKVDHALTFGAFFIEGNDGELYGSFVEAVTALHEARSAAAGLEVAVSVLSRRIAGGVANVVGIDSTQSPVR
jgi:hypothetical protein